MSNILPIVLGFAGVSFVGLLIAYFMMQKKMQSGGGKAYELEKMLSSTKGGGFSMEIFYQKAYLFLVKIPYVSRYLYKIRKRLEILNNNDEFNVRKQAAKVTIMSLISTGIILAILINLNSSDAYMMILSLLGVTVIHETMVEVMVNKLEDKILKQQLDLFSEVRHYYHECGMVEEAIYEASQALNSEISVQGTAIHDMLTSNDCETELEKYYDTAPNRFLKAFAGVSYLTKEFGDRKVEGASLYLKNINNITQELQMEIMKRDRIDYIFQSLTVISIAPMFVIKGLREWAVSTFSITSVFYDAKIGKLAELIILLMGFFCYSLLRRIKENNDRIKVTNTSANPIQAKLYKFPVVEWIVDRLMPQTGSRKYAVQQQLLIDVASPMKLEWLYVNRIIAGVIGMLAMLMLLGYLHFYALSGLKNNPTVENASFGDMTASEKQKAQDLTNFDNNFIEKYKDKKYSDKELTAAIIKSTDFANKYPTDEAAEKAAERIVKKINTANTEYIKPMEVIISMLFGLIGYNVPILVLKFQRKMRELEKENEVMQFQTLILMLMRIERISVETVLEWLERFSNIFRPQLSTCVNNFEAGGWVALEQLKEEMSYQPFIRIAENLQAAVDKIPIVDAFDELESERAFFQEKRKESNERLIAKKSMIGKVIGFTPMIILFVAYLIVPLIGVSMSFMGEYLSKMGTYM